MSAELNELSALERAGLIEAWKARLGAKPPPSTSQDMMRLIIGWEIQAKAARAEVRSLKTVVGRLMTARRASGDSDSPVITAKPKTRLLAGTRLSREWQGRSYSVDVLGNGFVYEGQLFRSLSPIAKAITGSHRSGPHFFGVSK